MHEKNKYRHIPWNRYNLEKYRDTDFWSYRPALILVTSYWTTDGRWDYFDDVFMTLLGLDSVIYLTVNGTSQAHRFSSKWP